VTTKDTIVADLGHAAKKYVQFKLVDTATTSFAAAAIWHESIYTGAALHGR